MVLTPNLAVWNSQPSLRVFVQNLHSVFEGIKVYQFHFFSEHMSTCHRQTWGPTVFLVYSDLK